jgi:hypothetical protein
VQATRIAKLELAPALLLFKKVLFLLHLTPVAGMTPVLDMLA